MKLTLFIIYLFVSISANGQDRTSRIEVLPYFRFDSYPQFSYVFNGRPSTDYVTIKGVSAGLGISYKLPLTRSISISAGIGYYNYSFNHISKINTQFGKANARNIEFISPFYITFVTNKYYYTTIYTSVGIEKRMYSKKNLSLISGLQMNNYYSLSENYHLSYNPGGSQDFRKQNKRYFGTSLFLNSRLIKKYKGIEIGPTIIIPVFDIWHQDETFPEEVNRDSRTKWLNGIGFGFSCSFPLTKNKK